MPAKRKISDLLNPEPGSASPKGTRRCLESPQTQSQVTPPPRLLAYPEVNSPSPPTKPIAFQLPTPLLSFSHTPSPNSTLQFDDSSLRYYVDPPNGADLNYGYNRWIRKREARGRIDGLLEALVRLNADGRAGEVGVVCWRGVMTRILTAPYEDRPNDGWQMNVICVDGTLYFEEHVSEERIREKEKLEPHHHLQSYYGYSFESYCTSATPRRPPDPPQSQIRGWGGDVDTHSQWCSVVKTKLGGTRMIIGGEVDCVRGNYSGSTDTFVELKTSLAIKGPRDEAKFEKKLLKFYFQSFLLGVPEIMVGFRTPAGYLTTTQSFKTMHIPRLVRGKPGAWDPGVCLDWGSRILGFLRSVCLPNSSIPDAVGNEKPADRAEAVQVWRVKFIPGTGVEVVLLDDDGVLDVVGGEERVGFFPRWFWDRVKERPANCSRGFEDGGTNNRPEPSASSRGPTSPVVVPPGWQI